MGFRLQVSVIDDGHISDRANYLDIGKVKFTLRLSVLVLDPIGILYCLP